MCLGSKIYKESEILHTVLFHLVDLHQVRFMNLIYTSCFFEVKLLCEKYQHHSALNNMDVNQDH